MSVYGTCPRCDVPYEPGTCKTCRRCYRCPKCGRCPFGGPFVLVSAEEPAR